MLVLVGGHLVGIAIDVWLTKENLPLSMMTGMKEAPAGTVASERFLRIGGGLLLALTIFAMWWFAYAWHEPVEQRLSHNDAAAEGPQVAFIGPRLPDDATWREECGACHLAFHPNLLPARSWERLIAEQNKHFGTDLALAPDTAATILAFLSRNAAESNLTEAAFKINRSIPADSSPLRITDTRYWVSKHSSITSTVWTRPEVRSKSNCAACHLDAVAGTFQDSAMRLPP